MRFRSIDRWLIAGAVVIALTVAPRSVYPQGWIEPAPRHPALPQVERLSSDVTITVDGARRVARVMVEERFRNASSALLEGDYLYPIPSDAVFTDFSLFMGDRELRGEILPAERARSIYEEIVRRKKDPALIELLGHGVIRARVFPVAPGDTRRVILRYTQVLGRDGDLVRLSYPRIVGVVPGTETRETAAPHYRPDDGHRFSLRVRVRDARRFGTPYSPTHTIEVREHNRDEVEIVHSGSDREPRDFELFLPLRDSRVGASVVTHALDGEPGFFMLMIAPPATAAELEIPRDVTLVFDNSGSMSGVKLEQARSALDQILAGLRPDDRFRLIAFNSVVRSFQGDFAAASDENIRAARDFLAGLRAEGSTNIMDALTEALEPEARAGRLSIVLFLTDGKPTVGVTEPERIAESAARLRDGERVFAFGVGYDVNTYLLDRMAEGGRGAVSYVQPDQDVEATVSALTRKIRHPALADLRIAGAPVDLEDYYPNPLPDLFLGEELVLFGRYRGHGTGALVLEGTRAGDEERLSYRVEFPERQTDNEFIPKLWAARKAGMLTAQIRLHGANPELIEEIRELGLRYGVITEYTSYLVEEPEFALRPMPLEDAVARARSMDQAPAAQTGAAAFKRAEASNRLAQAEVVDDAEAAALSGAGGSAHRGRASRHVGRRTFVLRDGVWTDTRHDAKFRVVEVAAYSPAYFELVSRIPRLKPYLALGERVRIAGDGIVLEVSPDGVTEWRPAGLRRVVAAFAAGL